MRNHSRQNLRTFHRGSGIPRTLTGEKSLGCCVKESEVRVGKYKYDPKDELGRGFSGNVYKGVEIARQHNRFAIKVVNLKKFKGHSLEMLEGEIEIHRGLEHESIVRLHDVVKTTTHYYLVMEYCPHGNLNEFIAQKKQLSESNALQIMSQLISAYRHLLSEGVIHRDIKPANILRVGNKWKLSDFGFAARARFGFKDRVSVGTPLYMAPESLRRNYYSFKSDLYSLGVVLFEMLTGHTPFEAQCEKELIEKVVTEIPVPEAVKNSQVADMLSKLTLVSDAKRMSKEEFNEIKIDLRGEMAQSRSNSLSNSNVSVKGTRKGSSTDESSLNRCNSSSNDLRSASKGSKMQWLEGSNNSSRQLQQLQQPQKKNPMMVNHEAVTLEFEMVRHHYTMIQNMESVQCEDSNRDMLLLVLFKLLLKNMRMLCDKGRNSLSLPHWEEYQQCKLYQQIYQEFTIDSERYEKEYLQFVKHNDIKVIRAVNRKFPELCSNNPLTSRFYDNFKGFMATIIRQHDLEVTNMLAQGETAMADRFEALRSLFTTYRVSDIRSDLPSRSIAGERPVLLADFCESKMGRNDFNSLKRQIKDI